MSSNFDDDDDASSVENDDATTISNDQNQSIQEEEEVEENHQASIAAAMADAKAAIHFVDKVECLIILVFYCKCIAVLHLFDMYDPFPSKFYFIIPVILVFIGFILDIDHLFIPFIFTFACDLIYARIYSVFLFSFHFFDHEFLLNKFLYDYWPETAKKFEKINRYNYFLVLYMIQLLLVIGGISCGFMIQFIMNNYKKNKSMQNTIRELRQQLEDEQPSQNLYDELLLAELPPPPSYQDFFDSIASPPQNGIPPPAYSMLEREEEEHRHLVSTSTALPQSINNHSFDTTILETPDPSETSSNNSLNESTAMSPSSIVR